MHKPLNCKTFIVYTWTLNLLSFNYRYFVQVHQKGKKDEKVLELVPDTVEFVDMGDRGHRQVVSQYKFDNLPADVYNSKTVYNNPGLGIEAVGG